MNTIKEGINALGALRLIICDLKEEYNNIPLKERKTPGVIEQRQHFLRLVEIYSSLMAMTAPQRAGYYLSHVKSIENHDVNSKTQSF